MRRNNINKFSDTHLLKAFFFIQLEIKVPIAIRLNQQEAFIVFLSFYRQWFCITSKVRSLATASTLSKSPKLISPNSLTYNLKLIREFQFQNSTNMLFQTNNM